MAKESSSQDFGANPLFSQVFLRLPAQRDQSHRAQSQPSVKTGRSRGSPWPTHITLQLSAASQRCAVEEFEFTRIVQEKTTQIELFEELGMPDVIDELLHEGTDGLLASAGATRNGKVCSRS